MIYRTNRLTGDSISIIGIGTSSLSEAGEADGHLVLERAFEAGINYVDLAAADSRSFPWFADVYSSVRNKMLYQIHFGADYSGGSYGWSLDLDVIKRSVDLQLSLLKTSFIDYGFIHCMDELSDFEAYKRNGVLDYILSLRDSGVIRHIGLSSHTPSVVRSIIGETDISMLMFSINPAYDYSHGEFAKGSAGERASLYTLCEKKGIGISVMKAFSGGQLLDSKTSPFGKALTKSQCIQYALDKPGVLTVLPGIRGCTDLDEVLGFFNSSPAERDYSVIGSFAPGDAVGRCVYCNHCQPCPAGIDIALVNKYYDLSLAGDSLARNHYAALEKNASACIRCGHCNRRCPFRVDQMSRMRIISASM